MKIYRVVMNYYRPAAEEPGSATFILAAKSAEIAEEKARASLVFEGQKHIETAYAVSQIITLSGLMRELKKNPDRAFEIERKDF